MPSNGTFEKLMKKGIDLIGKDALRYNKFDSLATSSDLENLFEVLTHYHDNTSNNPVFTAISIVANPDFNKIQESNFKDYFFEPFTDTLKRFPGCERSYNLWKEGINQNLFIPQMHGREHLNVITWMNSLRNNEKQTRMCFEEKFWGFYPDQNELKGVDFLSAFLLHEPNEINYHKQVIIEGLDLFEKLFCYRAKYFVPPNGKFNNELNFTLAQHGIKLRSVSKIQNEPIGFNKKNKRFHWLGKQDISGIRYITRNCFFEPSKPGRDWIDSCLNDIKIAFRWNKPAIISTHRVNYVGSLNLDNRDKGLKQLKILLKEMLRNWPGIEFMITPMLDELMGKNHKDFELNNE